MVDDRSGQPDRLSPAGYSKSDYDRSWSSQEWKSGAAEHDRSGKPDKTSWNAVQQVAPHREEPLLGRNAHSARYGELIHDRKLIHLLRHGSLFREEDGLRSNSGD